MEPEIFHEADQANRDNDLNGFMTLEEAKINPRINPHVFSHLKDIYNSVVQIIVHKRKNGNPGQYSGTGFVFHGPRKLFVMTNYHVIKDHEGPIQVKFFYDSPAPWFQSLCLPLCQPLCLPLCQRPLCLRANSVIYYSRDGAQGPNLDENHRDFAVLDVDGIPPGVDGLLLESTTSRSKAMFDQDFWESIRTLEPAFASQPTGIVIGHPLLTSGSYKRISIVDLHPCDNVENFHRCYSSQATQPGSSGSPVVINLSNNITSPVWVFVLHFASGFGISILKVIESISDQIYRPPMAQEIGSIGMAPEIFVVGNYNLDGFKTLAEAEQEMSVEMFKDIKVLYNNTVLIIAGKNRGTGFVLNGPGGYKLIITEYDVIKNCDNSEGPIKVIFSYDEPNSNGIECKVNGYAEYDSFDGSNHDKHVFAALSVNVDDIPREAKGISLEPTTGRFKDMFNQNCWDSSPKLESKAIVIGHPLGGHKLISYVNQHPCDNVKNAHRCYSTKETRLGSCGSPIVINMGDYSNLVLHFAPEISRK